MSHAKGNPQNWLRSVLKRGDTVIDGGANMGICTETAAEIVGPTGTVYAVEPDPRCHEKLDELAKAYPQITVIKAALGISDDGYAELYRGTQSEQNSLVRHAVKHLHDTIVVNVIPIYALARDVAAVKLDLQGGELDAIIGAGALLESRTQWCVEVWPHALGARGSPLLEAFRHYGLTPHWMDDGYPRADWDELIEWVTAEHEPHRHKNLIFKHE